MEPLIIVSLLVSLAALAPRYGNDSRDSFNSVEHWYARRGRRW